MDTVLPAQKHLPRVAYPGREAELNRLWSAFSTTSAGAGVMWIISGDAGMGKTTLGETVLSEIRTQSPAVWIGRGGCSERLAESEAYIPINEALHSLLRGESGDRAAQAMKTAAPAWYAQLVPSEPDQRAAQSRPASHE